MMAHAAIALAFSADRPDRQLRLIGRCPDERPGSTSEERAHARPRSDDAASAPEQTLAQYLDELDAGSPCFCCGEDLVAGDEVLVCPVCGAAIRREAA